jgi:peroxiredoxin
VFGLSSQTVAEQAEAVSRLELPFAMLSDPELRLGAELGLPTFVLPDGVLPDAVLPDRATGAARFYRRLTMIVSGTAIERVFYPVEAPGEHAADVLTWFHQNPNPHTRV